MKKIIAWCLCVVLYFITPMTPAIGADKYEYKFDGVDVIYAASFTALPHNINSDNWLTQLAGGRDKPIKVIYGQVGLKSDGKVTVTEEFIKLSGANGSERFLSNSASFDYFEDTHILRKAQTQLWSAKKLEGTSVVKDFTGDIKSVTIQREYNRIPQLTSIILSVEGLGSVQSTTTVQDNIYIASLDTLIYSEGSMGKSDSVKESVDPPKVDPPKNETVAGNVYKPDNETVSGSVYGSK